MCEREWVDANGEPFDIAVYLQSQIALAISANLASAGEVRAAVEAIASNDEFWRLVAPMLRVVERSIPGMAAEVQQLDTQQQQQRRGQA